MIDDAATPPSRHRQSTRFLLLYALAAAGAAIAYVPFLTLLLPARMAELAGARDVEWIGYLTFFGALAASGGGVFFGWLSDRTRRRLEQLHSPISDGRAKRDEQEKTGN